MARIRDVCGSNLDRNTDSLAGFFVVAIFHQNLKKNALRLRIYLKLGIDASLHIFLFNYSLSSNHPTL
jgi:hypothetical protein